MKLMKLSVLAIAVMAVTIAPSQANETAPDFDYISASYESTDFAGEKVNGFGLELSRSINADWFMMAGLNYGSESNVAGTSIDFDFTNISVGAAYKFHQTETTAFYAGLGLVYLDASASGFGETISDSDTGYGLTLGVRHRFTPAFEFDGQVQHVDVAGDSDQQFSLTGKYFFQTDWSARLNYTFVDSDNSSFGIGVSYHF
ncbi:porin family protein [Pseudidiomarina taiwanensis]|uniref:Outer membrane protein beta-barrel domain-containing protein n=1 Tax=Pseudidiomarina taiwanensis TaxID=337250 RepID=A0A432ZLX2_9GAMM|nr:porin family protein [Pseudidiomarina taiwanensis]RUO78422.1 hypothetical protein CWI83_05190 [Pseudidiomarina taiwanensis]